MIFKGKSIKIVGRNGRLLDEEEDSEVYERLATMLEKLPEEDLDEFFVKKSQKILRLEEPN